MVTKEDALVISRYGRNGKTNRCAETENYWIFSDRFCSDMGGTGMPLAVSKKDGSTLGNWELARIHGVIVDSDVIRAWDIDENGNFTPGD